MWDVKDYLLYGDYCDSKTIKNCLVKIRKKAYANTVILFVIQEEMFFQSLCLISSKNKVVEKDLQKILFSNKIEWPKNNRSVAAVLKKSFSSNDLTYTLKTLEPFKSVFCGVFDNNTRYSLLSDDSFEKKDDKNSFKKTTVYILLVDPNENIVLGNLQTLYKKLEVMINCCSNVLVDRGLKYAQSVEKMLLENEKAVNFNIKNSDYWRLIGDYADAYIRAATKLTRSDVGQIYLICEKEFTLRKIASVGGVFSDININDSNNVVVNVFKKNKPFLINDTDEFNKTHPNIVYEYKGNKNGQKANAELAVPIIRQNIYNSDSNLRKNRTSSIIGVINVERIINNQELYRLSDIEVLRNIASRFWLRLSQLINAYSSATLVDLTMANIKTSTEIVGNNNYLYEDINNKIPYEAEYISDILTKVIKSAYLITNSKSVTIRMISNNGKQLIRYKTWPIESMKDKYAVIDIEDKNSINSWVVSHGKELYCRDLKLFFESIPREGMFNNEINKFRNRYKGLRDYYDVRDNINSEYCIPLFVNGRIVGTLDLESEHKDAYTSDVIYLIKLMAEQIELSLSIARHALSQEILSISSKSTEISHEISKSLREITDLKKLMESDNINRETVNKTLKSIKERFEFMSDDKVISKNDILSEFSFQRFISLENIINKTFIYIEEKWEKDDIAYFLRKEITEEGAKNQKKDSSLAEMFLPIKFAKYISKSLYEIIENAFESCLICDKSNPYICFSKSTKKLGGKNYLILKVINTISEANKLRNCCSAYRLPIKKSLDGNKERICFGAFLAGSFIRTIGGEVSLEYADDNAIVTIEIPVERKEDIKDENV